MPELAEVRLTADYKNKISKSLKGLSKTDKHRGNISKALKSSAKFKEVVQSKEYRQKHSNLSKGENNGNAKTYIFTSPSGEVFEIT